MMQNDIDLITKSMEKLSSLGSEYVGLWVAVYGETLLCSAKTLKELTALVEACTPFPSMIALVPKNCFEQVRSLDDAIQRVNERHSSAFRCMVDNYDSTQ